MIDTPQMQGMSILGVEVAVEIDDAKCIAHGADGLYESYTIYLKSEYITLTHYFEVFQHECFHAICDILGAQLDIHTEEILANSVGMVFSQITSAFLGNPDEPQEDDDEIPEIPNNHKDYIGLI